jgi:hypothetical protein
MKPSNNEPLHVRNFVRHGIKSWVAIDLVPCRFKKGIGVVGVGSGDMLGLNDPDAYAFIATGVEVTSVFERHFGIGGVEATDMLVAEAAFATDEYFPEGPFFAHGNEVELVEMVEVRNWLKWLNLVGTCPIQAIFKFNQLLKQLSQQIRGGASAALFSRRKLMRLPAPKRHLRRPLCGLGCAVGCKGHCLLRRSRIRPS